MNFDKNSKTISLEQYGIKQAKTHYQLTAEELQAITIANGMGSETENGTLAVNTGEFTGRSPKDRFIVKDQITRDKVWWGPINIPFEPDDFDALYDKVVQYLSHKELFVRDAYACADSNYKLNIRVINEYPWSNMFALNMFLRPDQAILDDFQSDWLIVNAPGFMANPQRDKTRQHNFAILNFSRKIALIGGTGYTGEIKKGIFSALNFLLPVTRDALPMHCSANVGEAGDTAIFFGLSGTGKTTLLKLIGGQLRPDQGTIEVDGENIHALGTRDLYKLRMRMGMLFQSGALLTDINVFENVAYPLREHTDLSENMLRRLVLLKLEAVGLRGARDLMPSELSGGMARRVALARAIALDPMMIMYDEPFTGQDPISMGVLVKLIRSLNDAAHISSIMVSHDVRETLEIADMVFVISNGKVVDHGEPEALHSSAMKWTKQFIEGLPDGPVPFHYPAPELVEDLLD